MKKPYNKPELDVEWFMFEDIITLSGDHGEEDMFDENDQPLEIPIP